MLSLSIHKKVCDDFDVNGTEKKASMFAAMFSPHSSVIDRRFSIPNKVLSYFFPQKPPMTDTFSIYSDIIF